MRAMSMTRATATRGSPRHSTLRPETQPWGGNITHLPLRWVIFPPMGRGEGQAIRSQLGDTFTYGEARQAGLGDSRIYGLRDRGDIIALGCNDVPKPGGGLYWPGKEDRRDHVLGFDANDKQRDRIVELLISRLPPELHEGSEKQFKSSFREALDITEYGRSVHAEMDALLSCARSGVSPVGSILYTTTFPCHNCTRHIIAAGIERVFYIEPYAKSRAEELHEDAIVVEEKARDDKHAKRRRVPFTPFVGVGPRRYFDLFSLTLSRGYEVERKHAGKIIEFSRQGAIPRVPMTPFSYIQKEAIAIKELESLPKQLEIFGQEEMKRNASGEKQDN